MGERWASERDYLRAALSSRCISCTYYVNLRAGGTCHISPENVTANVTNVTLFVTGYDSRSGSRYDFRSGFWGTLYGWLSNAVHGLCAGSDIFMAVPRRLWWRLTWRVTWRFRWRVTWRLRAAGPGGAAASSKAINSFIYSADVYSPSSEKLPCRLLPIAELMRFLKDC